MKPLPLVCAVLFAVAHTQSPLYYSNQNQYFLKGVANGTDTPLSHDWLVTTADPVPAFSAFVAFCVRVFRRDRCGAEWVRFRSH